MTHRCNACSAHSPANASGDSSTSTPIEPTRLQKLDSTFTHPLWGLLILIGVLGMTMLLTYAVGLPLSSWFYNAIVLSLRSVMAGWLTAAPDWLQAMLLNGVLAGVGTVLSFIPILLIFFTILALFENSGYLARASRITGRYLRLLGLPGQACIPLSMGFGCNTAAILGCRVLQERRSRLLTMLLVPFVPCTSRIAVIAFLTPAFFGAAAPWVTWGLISVNLIVLASVALLVGRFSRKKFRALPEPPLPLIHLPNLRAVLRTIGANTAEFLANAGSLILVFTLATWVLSYLPNGRIEDSYLSELGQTLSPLSAWAGLSDWRLSVALLASLASKENIVAVLGVLFPVMTGTDLSAQVALVLSPSARLAFLVIQMLFIPCAGSLAALRQESGSWKLPAFAVGLMFGISLIAGGLVYQMGK